MHPEEGLLHRVFGVFHIAQHGIGHLEDEPRVLAHDGLEVRRCGLHLARLRRRSVHLRTGQRLVFREYLRLHRLPEYKDHRPAGPFWNFSTIPDGMQGMRMRHRTWTLPGRRDRAHHYGPPDCRHPPPRPAESQMPVRTVKGNGSALAIALSDTWVGICDAQTGAMRFGKRLRDVPGFNDCWRQP